MYDNIYNNDMYDVGACKIWYRAGRKYHMPSHLDVKCKSWVRK